MWTGFRLTKLYSLKKKKKNHIHKKLSHNTKQSKIEKSFKKLFFKIKSWEQKKLLLMLIFS